MSLLIDLSGDTGVQGGIQESLLQDPDKTKSDNSVSVLPLPRTSEADIVLAPAGLAENIALLAYLTALINTVYTQEEGEFWQEGQFARCTLEEVGRYIVAGELAIAWRHGSAQTDTKDLMGCVRVQMIDSRTGEFGVLMCDPASRGLGLGRDLLKFAETWARKQGAEVMQLELLIPDGWHHASKARLAIWYERAGFGLIRVGDVVDEFPHLTPILVRPAKVCVYHKALSEPAHH